MKIENKKMNELKVGDILLGENNEKVVINEVFEEHTPKTMYEIEMADGQKIKSSGNHLWYCETDTDRKEKQKYRKQAKKFFKHNVIPEKDINNPSYPISLIGEHFSNDPKYIEFIKRVCLSLGPSITTPNVIFDEYMTLVDDYLEYLYSYNDLIDFLSIMKSSIINNAGSYFYFGKVRSTEEIFSIIDEDINIPEKGDIINAK